MKLKKSCKLNCDTSLVITIAVSIFTRCDFILTVDKSTLDFVYIFALYVCILVLIIKLDNT